MKKGILAVMIVTFSMVVGLGTAQAEVALQDDVIFGSESIILDIDNQKEFLHLSFTVPYTYAEVVNEFGAGGIFAGWRVASKIDMDMLGTSAQIIGSTDPGRIARAEMLRDWFGEGSISSTHNTTRGLISDIAYHATYNGERVQLAYSIGVTTYIPVQVTCNTSGYAHETQITEKIFLTRPAGSTPPVINPDDTCNIAIDPTNPNCAQICIPTSHKEKGKKCSDGIDNDCDGRIDAADSDCVKEKGGKKNQ